MRPSGTLFVPELWCVNDFSHIDVLQHDFTFSFVYT